ncbi:hypothetical protein TraAM80_08214 [Trypanosoma rangeli]|uniref:Uncharacterized protein n=1 Tax=Trypanosoma rangeli TaxID=5698 RepID=A0A3R7NA43_TRYRA|nr:uncharacterized protein TraAM80_08214 [Trypanosoma rangeli]RNE99393.1 hypothetical protein TraAM80_08214 [Trypanosoma rangeli]|eukprot:RNE99393.1 hypothetical protein TraAM80_08214 [Trypanosoma rangeli]
MKSLEYKLARLEEQNASLRQKLRHQENEISRLSVRESHLKEMRRMPLLQRRLNAVLTEREELECRLAEARGREAKLSDEVNLLRMFVKLDKNPELAETARQCVNHERIQEELKALGGQLGSIAAEREEYKKRALLSCEEAEYYHAQLNVSCDEKKKLEAYIEKLLAEQMTTAAATSSSGCGIIGRCSFCGVDAAATTTTKEHLDNDDMQQLRRHLEEERARSEALQETIDALYEQQREQRRSSSKEWKMVSPSNLTNDMDPAGQGENNSSIYVLRRHLDYAEGECRLIKNRWHALRDQNKALLSRIAEVELAEAAGRSEIHRLSQERERVRYELEFVRRAQSLVSCRPDERISHEGPNDLPGLTQ